MPAVAEPVPEASWSWKGHPLWLVGFRPFFFLASLTGVFLPVLWVLVLTGVIGPPTGAPALQWHAHEMFFGFGLAVLGGFLLTATKNWVKVRGHFGHTLQFLVAAWLFERVGLWFGGAWPAPLVLLAEYLFPTALTLLLMWTLLRHRSSDIYRDNALFLVMLPALLVSRGLLLSPAHFAEGKVVTLALFRLAFLVMLERTLPPFMKGAFQLTLPRSAAIDWPIKLLGVLLIFTPLLPPWLHTGAALALAVLFTGRLVAWGLHRALTRLDVGVMYLGGLALAAELVLEALPHAWTGAMTVHVFTFGVMGLIIPAMITRLAKGHTGRKVAFDRFDKAAVWVMLVGLGARVVAPQFFPAAYQTWVWVAALAWTMSFAIIVWRTTPLLFGPRIDGKEH